jgi:hypothetical protein
MKRKFFVSALSGLFAFFCSPKRKEQRKGRPRGNTGYTGSLAPCPRRASRETRASRSNSAACYFRPFHVSAAVPAKGETQHKPRRTEGVFARSGLWRRSNPEVLITNGERNISLFWIASLRSQRRGRRAATQGFSLCQRWVYALMLSTLWSVFVAWWAFLIPKD